MVGYLGLQNEITRSLIAPTNFNFLLQNEINPNLNKLTNKEMIQNRDQMAYP